MFNTVNNNAIRENIVSITDDEDVLLIDGFDEAIIGLTNRINTPTLAVYSWEAIVNILVERDGLSLDDAMEYVDFNILGAWVGERTPIVVMPLDI